MKCIKVENSNNMRQTVAMSRAAIILCVQAFLLQHALSAPANLQQLQLANGFTLPNNLQLGSQNIQNLQNSLIIDQGCNQVVTEVLPSLQCGDVSVTGDLPIGGTIRVSGCFPVYGVVAVDGAVPSAGTAIVNQACC